MRMAYRAMRRSRSALRVLRRLAGLLESVLLALDGTRVTGQEAGLLQGGSFLGLNQDQRAGDRQAQRACLPGWAATVEVGVDVEAVHPVHGDQRSLDQLLMHLVGEVGL